MITTDDIAIWLKSSLSVVFPVPFSTFFRLSQGKSLKGLNTIRYDTGKWVIAVTVGGGGGA